MKKKNLLLGVLALTGALALASCDNSQGDNSNTTVSTPSTETTTTTTAANENDVVEDEFFEAHTVNDFEKDIDVSNLDRFNLSLKQKVLMSKALSEISFTSIDGSFSSYENEYYLSALHEYKQTTKCSGKIFKNDVVQYSVDNKVTFDGQESSPYMPISGPTYLVASPSSAKLASTPKVVSPMMSGSYTENVTVAYSNNYVYSHSKGESIYYGAEDYKDVYYSTLDDVVDTLKSRIHLTSFTSGMNISSPLYKIDDNHLVTKFNYSSFSQGGSVMVGLDEKGDPKYDTRSYKYEGAATIYFSYFNDAFYVDYLYMDSQEKSNYILDEEKDTYVSYPEYVGIEGQQFEFALSHNSVGDYNNKADFISGFAKDLVCYNASSVSYTPTYDAATNAVTAINQYSSSSVQYEVQSKTANSMNIDLVYSIYDSEKLYALNLEINSKTLNEKATKGEELTSSESSYKTESLPISIDLSNVQLLDGFSVVKFENKAYLKTPKLSSKSYLLYLNVTATLDANNNVTYTVNSVDFIEIPYSGSMKKVAKAIDLDSALALA